MSKYDEKLTLIHRETKIKGRAANFITLNNSCVQNSELSFRARGLLAFILSSPVHFRWSIDRIAAQAKEGRDAIRAALKELENHGYCRRETFRRPDGRIETACHFYEKRLVDNRATENQSPESLQTVDRGSVDRNANAQFPLERTSRKDDEENTVKKRRGESFRPPMGAEESDNDARLLSLKKELDRVFYGEQQTNPLTPEERQSLMQNWEVIESASDNDWSILRDFYSHPREKSFARKSLGALIKNFKGELDRAKVFLKDNPTGRFDAAF